MNALQTKSIEPLDLDLYYMHNGKLYVVPWNEDFELGKPDGAKTIEWFRENKDQLTEVRYNGHICFYGNIKGEWVEYIAVYEDGMRMCCYLVRFGDMMLHKLVRFEE